MLEYAIISGHDKTVSNVVAHRATREPYSVAQPKEVVAQDLLEVEEHFVKKKSVCKSVQKPTALKELKIY